MAKKKTKDGTEATLEARLSEALRLALPFLPASALSHQLTFSIKLGHRQHEIDAQKDFRATGRCDVLITNQGRPLAVLELKRPGSRLADEDRKQVLSYARLIEPWPPLAILTNGKKVRLFKTFTGKEWQPKQTSEAAFSAVLSASAQLAESDVRTAVETLLGPSTAIWTTLVNDITKDNVGDLTGEWADALKPFPKDLIFPRSATRALLDRLNKKSRVIVLSGPPLSGKSNVLRELCLSTAKSNKYVVLFIDAGSSGHGILQSLATALTRHFGWSISTDSVRSWLLKLSNSKHSPALVIAIDGGDVAALKAELDELTSTLYGAKLGVVVAVDDGRMRSLTMNSTGRHRTRFGNLAGEPISVGLLDDTEFRDMSQAFSAFRIGFMTGAHRALEYRALWFLRSVAAEVISANEYRNENVEALLPSMAGLELIQHARDRFEGDVQLLGCFHSLAKAVVSDASQRGSGSAEFPLARLYAYMCRFDTARENLRDTEYAWLSEAGYIKESVLDSGERIVVPQVPGLVAACLATVLAGRLMMDMATDASAATTSLVNMCSKIPAGDVIGAHALLDAAASEGGLPAKVISTLLEAAPREGPFGPGSKILVLEAGLIIRGEVDANGSLVFPGADGERVVIEVEPGSLLSDYTSWLILSHLVGAPWAVIEPGENRFLGWLDTDLLVQLGSFRQPLRQPVIGVVDMVHQHNMPDGSTVICHAEEGIIEPITYSLLRAMSADRERAEYLVDAAVKSSSYPLLARMYAVLGRISTLRDRDRAQWARNTLNTRIAPALSDTGLVHN